MTEDEAIAVFIRANDVQPCDICGAMPLWVPARGPSEIAERIQLMTVLVDKQLFDEVPIGQFGRWTDVPLEHVTADAIANGGLHDHGVDDGIEIRCRGCSRRYQQRWVTERGYESWIVTQR